MSNVIAIRKAKLDGFSREVPEESTLLNLAINHPVKAFQIEHAEHGYSMVLAHFDHEGWHHMYQDGGGALSAHLFFWLIAWQGDETPENIALEFFQNQFILS